MLVITRQVAAVAARAVHELDAAEEKQIAALLRQAIR
jgi:hypothetical protein